jgi:hypothetical protein
VPVLMEAESETSSVAPMPTSAAMSKPLPQRVQTAALVGLGVWQCEQIIPMHQWSLEVKANGVNYSS